MGRRRVWRYSRLSKVDDVSLERCSSDDVLEDILSRLPLKSIFRFKCVSKRWHQVLSSDYFRVKIIKRNRMDPGPLYFFRTPSWFYKDSSENTSQKLSWSSLAEAKSVTNSSYPIEDRVRVDRDVIKGVLGDDFGCYICSSNGLLLCRDISGIRSPPSSPFNRYFIYNPLTRVGYSLPNTRKQRQPRIARDCIGLIAGSSIDSYDMDGYKVVRAEASLSKNNIIELEVFSSHRGKWRLSTATVSLDVHKCFKGYSQQNFGVCAIKGALYWMIGKPFLKYIFVYYPDDEKHNRKLGLIKIIKAPEKSNIIWHEVGMGESVDGLLQLAVYKRRLTRDSAINVCVYHPQTCRWIRRSRLKVPRDFMLGRRGVEQVVISLHPLNPNIMFIRCGGCIFACYINTIPVLIEQLEVSFKSQLEQLVDVQPYLPPPWPISPLPAAQKKHKSMLDRAVRLVRVGVSSACWLLN